MSFLLFSVMELQMGLGSWAQLKTTNGLDE
jgi:hypothetical protein